MMKSVKNLLAFFALFSTSLVLSPVAAAATILTGPTFDLNAANWSNGAPAAGNDGTINSNYTNSGNPGAPANTTITQTGGVGTSTQFNFNGSSTFTFNLQGGSLALTAGTFFINQGITNVSGSGAITSTSQFQIANGGRFNISGGTLSSATTGTLVNANNTGTLNVLNLTGGVMTGSTATSFLQNLNLSSTIGGSAIVNAPLITSILTGTLTSPSTLNFLPTWTGSLNFSAIPSVPYATQLINSGATFNGVDISASNIGAFNITGGTITLAAIPEPGSIAAVCMSGLGFAFWIRRRRAA